MTYLLAATAAATAAPPPAAVTVPMAAGQSISPADVAAYIDPRDIASFMPPPPPTTELVAISGDFFGGVPLFAALQQAVLDVLVLALAFGAPGALGHGGTPLWKWLPA